MFVRRLVRLAAGVLAFALPVVGVPLLTANSASADASVAVRTVVYDASRAGEFVDVFHQAAAIWNSSVRNVRLESGRPAALTIYVDNGWPRAQPRGLGAGRIWMGRQAVNQGHYPLRIATHEIGHIFGLPDRRTGRCSELMSGSSAGTSCRNPNPDAREKAEVEANFEDGRVRVAALAASFDNCFEAAGHDQAHV
ncbi:MAG TPA: snapalysin family zinc-dependent metalloprotease [Pilimelia sp.]|nr:snapalysin family zinc-dependent metalloprotease [Pilimelia sp.]